MAVIKRYLPLLCIIVVSSVDGEDAALGVHPRIYRRYCISCHDADKQKGDLRIDTLSWALTETKPETNGSSYTNTSLTGICHRKRQNVIPVQQPEMTF